MAMIKIQGNTKIQGKTIFNTGDSDVNNYIAAVEAADGQALEAGVKTAYTDFILGCKSDGIWNSLKASCILAGARTLNGALVPLVGIAPTNFNFVSADYNRATGLKGNASNKWIDSNRPNNADPRDSNHNAVYVTDFGTPGVVQFFMDSGVTGALNQIVRLANTLPQFNSRGRNAGGGTSFTNLGFAGINRTSSTSANARYNSINRIGVTTASATPDASTLDLFRRGNASAYSSSRMSFYSIGEHLDLALLDTRVTNLMTAINAAI